MSFRTSLIVVRSALPLTLPLTLAVTLACGGSTLAPLPPGGHHVLFIGNSLTYVNDLPGTVAALAESVGDTIRASSVAKPDFALIDHLNGGSDAKARIALGGWEYVVLQQGPSSLAVNQDSLALWTRMFDPLIRNVGARPGLLMVWPASDRTAFFGDVRQAYQHAATVVNGVFLPAGAAWVKAWEARPSLPLYDVDGYHPSPTGTYLAALVVVECVTHRDARTFPAQARVNGRSLEADSATVRTLQQAAHDAIVQYHGC